MTAADNPDRWMRTAQIADLTGLPVTEIRRRIRAGELPARKAGKHHLILQKDYLRWVNSLPASSELATPSKATA